MEPSTLGWPVGLCSGCFVYYCDKITLTKATRAGKGLFGLRLQIATHLGRNSKQKLVVKTTEDLGLWLSHWLSQIASFYSPGPLLRDVPPLWTLHSPVNQDKLFSSLCRYHQTLISVYLSYYHRGFLAVSTSLFCTDLINGSLLGAPSRNPWLCQLLLLFLVQETHFYGNCMSYLVLNIC